MSVIDSVKLPNGNEYDVMAKLDGATEGNLAAYDVNENLSDSGIPVSAIGQKQTKNLETPLVIGGTTETTVEGALGGLNDEKQDNLDLTSETETGNPLSFITDSEQVAQNVAITFEPIQAGSGDPSPSNPRTIYGYGWVDDRGNQMPLALMIPRKNYWGYGDKSDTRLSQFFCWIPAGTYTLSANVTSSDTDASTCGIKFFYNDYINNITVQINRGSRQSVTVTLTQSVRMIQLFASDTYAHANNDTFSFTDIMLEVGETATTYEAYNPATDIRIYLDETLYGFTWHIESGKLVVDKLLYTITGNETWGFNMSWLDKAYYLHTPRFKNVDRTKAVVCSHYIGVAGAPLPNERDGHIWMQDGGNNESVIFIGKADASSANLDSFKASLQAMGGVQVIYTLLEPITIQLPAHAVKLLQGANVVTTNGTSMSLTYRNGEVAKLSDLSGLADSVNGAGNTYLTRAENDITGASNLLPNKASTTVQSGVTFTVNDDGSVTLNGTATANAFLVTCARTNKDLMLDAGNYFVNTFANENVTIEIGTGASSDGATGSYVTLVSTTVKGTFSLQSKKSISCTIGAKNGVTYNNVVVGPMISVGDATKFVPYAKTNRELTERIVKTSVSGTTDAAGRIKLNKNVNSGYVPIGFKQNDTSTTVYDWRFASYNSDYYIQYSGQSASISGDVYWLKTF